MAEFSMVEELAFLIKDNLSCKHLVLSVEEMLIDFLQNNTSLDGIIELEPMSPYHRLMLHRLADIFGFAHESVGEGDDRHLVLQRCQTHQCIPLVLVSDILLQYDEYQPPTSSAQILKRKGSTPANKARVASSAPLLPVEEREAAYLAARERIFSLYDDCKEEPVTPKPRTIPVAARRMIAHALGQRISSSVNASGLSDSAVGSQEGSSSQRVGSQERKANVHVSHSEMKEQRKAPIKASEGSGFLGTGSEEQDVGVRSLERERAGAARRIFANALGLGSARNSRPSQTME
ncbi:unnamed protein product [Spirodela intermedia]|uniref:Uncharacterized protein n=1 Tax=Spirodela intermedia TaxID=51605 RepID=A0A7I8JEX3_SPIIN|nr:unnamed protein product [Spirodela intermedia]CAA6667952.1 unnamed protein product [Spirodela intermedia]